jgi:uncharacterized membrane protein
MRQKLGVSKNFRWRGHEVSRIESFSDAVFAFAVTLLVVSLEVPKTFTELLATMQGFLAFAVSFAMLVSLWYYQYIFFRRYGLRDSYTITLNAILLFLVLFYVYPLKFVFSYVINALLTGVTTVRMPDGVVVPVVEHGQAALMMIVYGVGFIAIFILLALLYHHAYGRRERLQLTELELYDTKASRRAFLLQAAVGALSVAIAALGGPAYSGIAGFSYFLLGPVLGISGWIAGRTRNRIFDKMQNEYRQRQRTRDPRGPNPPQRESATEQHEE